MSESTSSLEQPRPSPTSLGKGLCALGRALVSLLAVGLALGVLGTMVGLSVQPSTLTAGRHEVLLEINGRRFRHRTLARSPQDVLQGLGIGLEEGIADLPSAEGMAEGAPIRLTLPRVVLLAHDGSVTPLASLATTAAEVLAEGGISLAEHDRLYLDEMPWGADAALPLPALSSSAQLRGDIAAWVHALRRPMRLTVKRAVPVALEVGTASTTLHTTARTVGEALAEHGLLIYAGDRVEPGLDAAIVPGLTISLRRATPVTLEVGGRPRLVRTQAETVQDLLREQQIVLDENDYVSAAMDAPLQRNGRVAVVRVHEEYFVQEAPIAFETRTEPDPTMEIDQRRIADWGREGARRRRVRVRYENDREVSRQEEDEWIAREPQDRIIKYGTKIVLRQLDTPEGPITYWRKLRMLATSYNALTAGKALDHPAYGITRSGLRARKGLIAVDPRVIPLGTEMYVPGYGHGLAADTGSAIQWRRIDLCYDDDNLKLWKQWVDVYLLAPAPPEDEIEWIIPNWPPEQD